MRRPESLGTKVWLAFSGQFTHSEQEILCPIHHTCRSQLQSPSGLVCWPGNLNFGHPIHILCPAHTSFCPVDTRGGCYPEGLRCANESCKDYEYRTLVVPTEFMEYSSCALMEWTASAYPHDGAQATETAPLPISDRVLGNPTAVWQSWGR